jgi:hypothetical protein
MLRNMNDYTYIGIWNKPLPLGVIEGPIPLGVVVAPLPPRALKHVVQLEMVMKPTQLEGLLFHYGVLEVKSIAVDCGTTFH